MSEKKERLVTPIGEAKWAHIHQPKAPYQENGKPKGEPKYQIDVVFDPDDAEWKAWAAPVMKQIREMPERIDKKTGRKLEKQIPVKPEFDQDDNKTGRFYVTFKTGNKFKPGVFDQFGRVIEETILVGNGSKVRVNYTPSPYDAFGGGIAFYLNAVQVLDLVEYKSASAEAYGFETQPAPADDSFANADSSATPGAAGDGIPF